MNAQPLQFEPNIHTALWGHEEWLVSAHPSSPCVVKGGGETLDKLYPGFPLLVKIIEAHDALSVQVHPNEATAPLTGGEPKTEMWHILAAEKGAKIYAGLRPGTTAADVESAVRDERLEELLVAHEVKPGESYFIPGGTVHAIGGGVRIFEVQQSSNTTYRLYDWGRVDKNGRARELHLAAALKSIDYNLPVPRAQKDVECAFFSFSTTPPAGDDAFRIVYADGAATLYPPDVPLAPVASALFVRTGG